VTAQGADDTGGVVRLYYSELNPEPTVELDNTAWVAEWDYLDIGACDPGYYRAREEGNGVAYVGLSPFSQTFEV
jgi:hypothetical protein